MPEQRSLGFPALGHSSRKIPRLHANWEDPLALPRACPQTGSFLPHRGPSPMPVTRPSSFPRTGKLSELFRHFLFCCLPSGQGRKPSFRFLSCAGEAALIGSCWNKYGEVGDRVFKGTASAPSVPPFPGLPCCRTVSICLLGLHPWCGGPVSNRRQPCGLP